MTTTIEITDEQREKIDEIGDEEYGDFAGKVPVKAVIGFLIDNYESE